MDNARQKPFAQACENNGPAILQVLREKIRPNAQVLEIGSGTGQHAVQFAKALPGVTWQTSDVETMHEGIRLWLDEAKLDNLRAPLTLDVSGEQWPATRYDAIFSANTSHIMPAAVVEKMFTAIPRCLADDGLFLLYGPFLYDGKHTSESNWRFDRWIRAWEPHRGLRDVTWLKQIAATAGLQLDEDIEMPANNRILLWRKQARQ